MKFTSFTFLFFLALVLLIYWSLGKKNQNKFLLISSYFFYGYITPWFCLLLASSTVVDYFCGLAIHTRNNAKRYLYISLFFNLALLGVFKYFNFFVENIQAFLTQVDLHPDAVFLNIVLPVGISFYTFQTMSYTIDIYRKKITPTKDFVSFALFVSSFPQLVAGPIERAKNFLPQILRKRNLSAEDIENGLFLIIRGYVKKIVVADNVAIYVDKIFLQDHADPALLLVGSIGFAIQIYADFSAYTDIARGCAKLLGFDLMINFNSPYFAVSPSDFWRRWHISFSSWIRDYLYIPLGGSRHSSKIIALFVLLLTMGLSGLWHGAAWNYILWGLYHGLLLGLYHSLGCGGAWTPPNIVNRIIAVGIMFSLTVIGWAIFRTPSVGWLLDSFSIGFSQSNIHHLHSAATVLLLCLTYSLPLWIYRFIGDKPLKSLSGILLQYGLPLILIIMFHRDQIDDFIYFQF